MIRFSRTVMRVLAGLAALGSVAVAQGCDWLKASDMTQRQSPFLSGLSLNHASVLCGSDHEFAVSFRYDDPQGDIFQAKLVLQHEGDSTVRDHTELWPDTISRSAGTATFPLSFTCGDPGGSWTITVTVEDDLGHTSNILTGNITLNAAG